MWRSNLAGNDTVATGPSYQVALPLSLPMSSLIDRWSPPVIPTSSSISYFHPFVGRHQAVELASGGEHRGGHDELVGGAHVAGKGAGHGCYCEEQSSKAVRSGKQGGGAAGMDRR